MSCNITYTICYMYSFIKGFGTPTVTANLSYLLPLWIAVSLLGRNRLVSLTCSGVVRVLPVQGFGVK